jgi:hypothetical protein
VSLSSLACTLIVEILQIDGLAPGRAVMTGSVLACISSFFYLQNHDALRCVYAPPQFERRSLNAAV